MNKVIALAGFLCLALNAQAQPSADDIAQKRAEQAQPRTAVALDPKLFDKYVGYYQLAPKAVFTITRDGDHFFAQLTRQKQVEIFPESESKFFLKVVPAQISFDIGAEGKVTGLILHQGGRELPAPRIDEALAKRIEGAPLGHPMARTWPMLAGVAPRFLTSGSSGADYWPWFSPDGKTILFSRTSGGGSKFLKVPADGGDAEDFVKGVLPVAATRANWSPKNDKIAFTGVSPDGANTIWVVNGDGSDAHALATPGLSNEMDYPSWYPDGEQLAVMDARAFVIKRVNLNANTVVTVTDHAQVLTGMPNVSPDGKWIAFAGQKNEGQTYNQEENVIWIVGESGTAVTLETKPMQGRAPVWSPDGRRIAFESDRGNADGRYAVFIINRDGSGLVQVTDYALDATHPIWSPDGRRMAFVARDGAGIFRIAIVALPDLT